MKRSGISRLRVQNYQSIKDCDIPLGPLTVCVGDNEAGKSALLRAIRAACFNDTGTDFISHGQDKTTVELTLFSGDAETHLLRWRKKRDGGATYDLWELDVNGERHSGEEQHFSKLGSAVPPEVVQALGIVQIEVDKTLTITPQIHRQGEYAFLIDKSEGQAARALAKMTKLDVVVEAQGLVRADLRRVKQDLNSESSLIEALEKQEGEFVGLDDEVALLESVSDGIGLAESEIRRIAEMQIVFSAYHAARSVVEEAADLPSEEDIAPLAAGFNWVRSAKQALNYHIDWTTQLSRIPDIPPDTDALVVKLEQLQEMKTFFKTLYDADLALTYILEEDGALQDVHNRLLEEWNSFDLCPECGQPMPLRKYLT